MYGDSVAYALAQKEEIYKHSEACARGFRKFAAEKGILPGKRYGLVDFVSSGTCQRDMARIVDAELEGLYVCQYDIGDPKRRAVKKYSLITEAPKEENAYSSYLRKSRLYENYLLMEAIISSPETSVEAIEEDGTPVYGPERRDESSIRFMTEVQEGIAEFFEEYMRDLHLYKRPEISLECADEFIEMSHLKHTDERCADRTELLMFEDVGCGVMKFPRQL